jgi:hypothetical protein
VRTGVAEARSPASVQVDSRTHATRRVVREIKAKFFAGDLSRYKLGFRPDDVTSISKLPSKVG